MGFAEKDGAIALDEAEDMKAAVGTPSELGGLPMMNWELQAMGWRRQRNAQLPMGD
jgi:hypothetical protein